VRTFASMLFRPFKRTPETPPDAAWWRDAGSAERAPTPAAVAALRARMVSPDRSPDEAERQEEMLDGLERLRDLAGQAELPVLATQHRVIGGAACHFTAPASLSGQVDAPGKLFVTSHGLTFAGGRVLTCPWHRVRAIVRDGRAIVVTLAGAADPIAIVCNSYGDAMTARHLAARLRPA
jgi:hypothetical protein